MRKYPLTAKKLALKYGCNIEEVMRWYLFYQDFDVVEDVLLFRSGTNPLTEEELEMLKEELMNENF